MPKILFWNIHRENLGPVLAVLAHEHSIDLIVLAESVTPPDELRAELNNRTGATYYFCPPISSDPVPTVFVRYSQTFVEPFFDAPHFTIRRVQFPTEPELLLVAVHLRSQLHTDEISLSKRAGEVCETISERERTAGHKRTIVVGDFNMNPFSDGLISANAFNAVGVREVAALNSRTLNSRERFFFYNPMWRFFAEQDGEPAGTYYRSASDYPSMYWHVFDQVLFRPNLIHAFQKDSLRILTRCSGYDLLNKGGKPSMSDHLPIVFNLAF